MKTTTDTPATPPGLIAFGVLFYFAASMAVLAAFLLFWPGTPLDKLWAINPRAHTDLSSLGKWVSIEFLLLAVFAVYTAVLWFRRRRLAWRLAVLTMSVEVLGNLINIFRGDLLRGIAGIAIAALLLAYLLNSKVKAAFC
jgi:hypothetical protein